MPGKVIGRSFNFGYPGQIARQPDDVVRTRPVAEGAVGINFGDPVVINGDGSVEKFGTEAGVIYKASQFAGVAARRIKSATSYPNQELGVYLELEPCDVIQRGSVSVQVNYGTPLVGSSVYIRVQANPAIPSGIIGGFEATADGENSIELTNSKWGTGKDSNGVAELVILTRQGV